MNIKVGDVVRFVGGGPDMTVSGGPTSFEDPENGGRRWNCTWFQFVFGPVTTPSKSGGPDIWGSGRWEGPFHVNLPEKCLVIMEKK